MTQKTKDATTFYTRCSLLMAALKHGEYLTNSSQVHGTIKAEINRFNRNTSNHVKHLCSGMSESDYKLWMKQWKEYDYESLSETMRILIDMTDSKRNEVEEFAKQLITI